MSNVLISVRDLSIAYEGTTALDEVSLDIFEDDFLGSSVPTAEERHRSYVRFWATFPTAER